MIQTERLVQNFCKLVSFDSPSYGERRICDYLKTALQQLVHVLLDKPGVPVHFSLTIPGRG